MEFIKFSKPFDDLPNGPLKRMECVRQVLPTAGCKTAAVSRSADDFQTKREAKEEEKENDLVEPDFWHLLNTVC